VRLKYHPVKRGDFGLIPHSVENCDYCCGEPGNEIFQKYVLAHDTKRSKESLQ
jgi:hypothetical protein